MTKLFFSLVALAAAASAHGDHLHDQEPISGPLKSLWYNTLPGDGGTQVVLHILVLKLETEG